jgi:hypothetical protein
VTPVCETYRLNTFAYFFLFRLTILVEVKYYILFQIDLSNFSVKHYKRKFSNSIAIFYCYCVTSETDSQELISYKEKASLTLSE